MTEQEFDDIIYGHIAQSEQEELRSKICTSPLEEKIDFLCKAYAERIVTTSDNISPTYDIFQDYKHANLDVNVSSPRFNRTYVEIKNFLGGVVDEF